MSLYVEPQGAFVNKRLVVNSPYLVVLLAVVLVACSGPNQNLLVGLPPHPGADGDRTIEGVDSNNNGVRDDIEIYLATTYRHDEIIKDALTHLAVATQDVLNAASASADADSTLGAFTNAVNSESCLRALYGLDVAAKESDALVSMVINTNERIEMYYEAHEALAGQLLLHPDDVARACPSPELEALVESKRPALASIQPAAQCSPPKVTNIYFSNGVRTSFRGALQSVALIEDRFRTLLSRARAAGEVYNVGVAYNDTYGAMGFRDFQEVFAQKLQEKTGWEDVSPQDVGKMIFELENLSDPSNAPGNGNIYDGPVLEAYDAALFETGAISQEEASNREYYLRGTAQNHLQRYRTALLHGERVLVIAHSQGNLFALHAYEQLAEDESVSNHINGMDILAVATPASRTVGSQQYVTDIDDHVMNLLRVKHNNVLPGNYFNYVLPPMLPISRHSFKYYMRTGSATAQAIQRIVTELTSSLPFPSGTLGSGAIMVTLEWDEQPDVDLHVTEPNGTMVYWRNPVGPSGYLDRDDVDGYGPEHYFVSCEALEIGRYDVALNYYHGYAPTNARLHISANFGRVSKILERTLVLPRGPEGVFEPVLMASIDVRGTAPNYRYTIDTTFLTAPSTE